MRGGATRPFSGLPSAKSSFGAIMGSRRGRFPEAWPRRFCITRLVTVIRLTGGLAGRGSAMWKQVGSQHQHLPGGSMSPRIDCTAGHFFCLGDGIDSNKEELRERKRKIEKKSKRSRGQGWGGERGWEGLNYVGYFTSRGANICRKKSNAWFMAQIWI